MSDVVNNSGLSPADVKQSTGIPGVQERQRDRAQFPQPALHTDAVRKGYRTGLAGVMNVHVGASTTQTPRGCDVAGTWQGVVNWQAVHDSGASFGICKITEGTGFVDSQGAANWAGMAAHGIIRGGYLYFLPELDPVAQAQYYLSHIPHGPADFGAGTLAPIIDVEEAYDIAPSVYARAVLTCAQYLQQATKRNTIIYTYPYFWQYSLGNADLSAFPLWLARYGVARPGTIGAWPYCTFWQWTAQGTIPGVNAGGRTDLDYFNGGIAGLQKMAGN